MTTAQTSIELFDCHPPQADMRAEAVAGLSADTRTLSCKFLYDRRGSELFDAICELEEYYPTRTELAIMRAHGAEMADALGCGVLLVEYGSGSTLKIRELLNHLCEPVAYMPLDISREHLMRSARELAADYPDLDIMPVCADYTAEVELPENGHPSDRRSVYFAGSTIGNFEPDEAVEVLRGIAGKCGPAGGVLIGVDVWKDPAILHAAYNDREGVTAEFNLNLLRRFNRELDADFDLAAWHHEARVNELQRRVEMHLVSDRDQGVHINGHTFEFAAGETIHTENSYKRTLDEFAALAARAGLAVERIWTDPRKLFTMQFLRPA